MCIYKLQKFGNLLLTTHDNGNLSTLKKFGQIFTSVVKVFGLLGKN